MPTEGLAHHPRIVAGAGGALTVAWDESAGGARRIAIARGSVDETGLPRFGREAITPNGAVVDPALAVAADGVVAVWTKGPSTSATIQVARLTAAPAAVTRR